MMEKVTIILLAGGEASRYRNSFKPLTKRHHDKLLSEVGDISLLEYVCFELNSFGNVVVVTRGDQRQLQYSELLKKMQ
jgi:molybdopterin-guanine dinucleotide biosynthesis protein A